MLSPKGAKGLKCLLHHLSFFSVSPTLLLYWQSFSPSVSFSSESCFRDNIQLYLNSSIHLNLNAALSSILMGVLLSPQVSGVSWVIVTVSRVLNAPCPSFQSTTTRSPLSPNHSSFHSPAPASQPLFLTPLTSSSLTPPVRTGSLATRTLTVRFFDRPSYSCGQSVRRSCNSSSSSSSSWSPRQSWASTLWKASYTVPPLLWVREVLLTQYSSLQAGKPWQPHWTRFTRYCSQSWAAGERTRWSLVQRDGGEEEVQGEKLKIREAALQCEWWAHRQETRLLAIMARQPFRAIRTQL